MSASKDHQACVLVDTNVIIESYRIGCWPALAGGFRIETVEECVTKTQTGIQRRRPEETIDREQLRASLAAEHQASDKELADLAIRIPGIALDQGEESLWAHALTRNDVWVLCSPDKASLRCGVRIGVREQLVSLEELLLWVGHRPNAPLKRQYTKRWYGGVISRVVVEEGDY